MKESWRDGEPGPEVSLNFTKGRAQPSADLAGYQLRSVAENGGLITDGRDRVG